MRMTAIERLDGSRMSRRAHEFGFGFHVASGEDFDNREREDFDVQPEADVVNIPHVEFEFPLPADHVAAVDLGPAGDARADLVAAGLRGGISREITRDQRSRAD